MPRKSAVPYGGQTFCLQRATGSAKQDSLKRYGGNIELKAITQLSPAAYEEKLLEVVLPDWNQADDGCHTINVEDNFVVLDAIRLTPKNN